MSETTAAPATETTEVTDPSNPASFLSRLTYGVMAAITVDLGCVIGAIGFIILIALSAIFATQLTPCTSAGGIPCSPP